jgi:hypothetical protein
MSDLPAYLAPTFAERKAAREAAVKRAPDVKQVDAEAEEVEDKSIAPAKATRKRAAKKS